MSSATATPPATATPRPRKPRPRPFVWLGLLAVLAITLWSGTQIGFTLQPIIDGNPRAWGIVSRYFSPNWEFLFRVWPAWLETLMIAVIASAVGCLIGLLFALLASHVTNPSNWAVRVIKWFLSALRSLPEIGYALLLVAMVGVGSLAGILALIIFNLGIVAKLTSETIDAVDPGPVEAAKAAGARGVQQAATAVLPQIWPNYLSYCLYVFELNLRASAIIGIVGGGGIGMVLNVQKGHFNYENVSALVVGFILIVVILDRVSRAIRKRLL